MKKRAAAAELKVRAEEKKPKIVAKHETSEEEESEGEEEPEEVEVADKVEVSDTEQVDEDDEEEVEYEEVEEEEPEPEEEEEDDEEEEEDDEEEDDEASKKEFLRKLLEPLPKEKIIEFLKEAALNDPSIVATLTQTAEVDPAHRRIFVFGLGWDATTDQVFSAFEQYGDIEQCRVVTDKVTGKAKGYGFVLFKTRKSAQKSLKQTQKKIGGRMATCQLASAGPSGLNNNQTTLTTGTIGRKIFVANVKSHVNPEALRSLFAKFGEIEDGPSGIDRTTGKFKGFAMFVYKTVEGCKKALEEPTKVFDGCQLQCRLAVNNQRGNKNTKSLPSAASNSDIGNMGFGYGVYAPQLMNPAAAAGIMAGQNPMMVSALNQNSISSAPQSFGLGASYGMNTVTPNMLAKYGLGAYQDPQVGRSSAAGTTPAPAAGEQSGIGSLGTSLPPYLGR
ncbi:UBP1-associated protein 2A-like protein [Tanacetum coccineum]|uniref:UBP1-associated protein 2A-like protein n=1 Tax=Tanacetum coccineum TaxID=301880 RepID=A0ABQ5IJJ5_9ASTR